MKTVGLVGYGYWGPNLVRNYMDLPGVPEVDLRSRGGRSSSVPFSGAPVPG